MGAGDADLPVVKKDLGKVDWEWAALEAQAENSRLAAELAAARAEAEGLRADKARLDHLDACNAALNERYGTTYRWRLVLSHNVTRLMLGDMVVDLHDSDGSNTALPSCREAIDEGIRERALRRAARTAGGPPHGR